MFVFSMNVRIEYDIDENIFLIIISQEWAHVIDVIVDCFKSK